MKSTWHSTREAKLAKKMTSAKEISLVSAMNLKYLIFTPVNLVGRGKGIG